MTNPLIQISWQTGAPPPEFDEPALLLALAGFLHALGFSSSGASVLMADDAALLALNAEHRGQHNPTDILSWSYLEQGGDPPDLLGELAVSLERVQVQAEENGWSNQTELLRLLAHGCTHLAGYDHQTEEADREMRAVEIALLEGAGLRGIYPEG